MASAPRKQFTFHTSRMKYFFPYIFFIVLFAAGAYMLTKQASLAFMLIAGALTILIVLELLIRRNRVTLEDSQIVFERGILSRQTITTHYAAIVDILATQSAFQRILGVGDVHIKTTASTEVKEILLESFPKIRLIETFVKNKVHLHRTGKK